MPVRYRTMKAAIVDDNSQNLSHSFMTDQRTTKSRDIGAARNEKMGISAADDPALNDRDEERTIEFVEQTDKSI